VNVLVTGAAGFIGAHCVLRLLRDGHRVCGLDNFNDYYDPQLKHDRVAWVHEQAGEFPLARIDLSDAPAIDALFQHHRPEVVIHLAAQAGVRYSLENPRAYVDSNLGGFLNILESCRRYPVRHLIYASSSSVYGANPHTPYSEQDNVDHPLSLYAASKKANELMAHSYSHLFGIPCTGLRFFTVYGPWGRPDMSPIQFARAITEGRVLSLYNHGEHQRDFTYVDDIIESIARLVDRPPHVTPQDACEQPGPATSRAPWRIFNIGGQHPVALRSYVALLEKHLGRSARIELLPLQAGDVLNTCADASGLARATGFQPRIELDEGLGRFIAWFLEYYARPAAHPPLAAEPAHEPQRRSL